MGSKATPSGEENRPQYVGKNWSRWSGTAIRGKIGHSRIYTKFGIDYDKTFCLVVRKESLDVLMTLSLQYNLQLYQTDVIAAFLNSTLEEEMFMNSAT